MTCTSDPQPAGSAWWGVGARRARPGSGYIYNGSLSPHGIPAARRYTGMTVAAQLGLLLAVPALLGHRGSTGTSHEHPANDSAWPSWRTPGTGMVGPAGSTASYWARMAGWAAARQVYMESELLGNPAGSHPIAGLPR